MVSCNKCNGCRITTTSDFGTLNLQSYWTVVRSIHHLECVFDCLRNEEIIGKKLSSFRVHYPPALSVF